MNELEQFESETPENQLNILNDMQVKLSSYRAIYEKALLSQDIREKNKSLSLACSKLIQENIEKAKAFRTDKEETLEFFRCLGLIKLNGSINFPVLRKIFEKLLEEISS